MKLRKTPIGYNLIIQEDELELCLIKEAYPLSNGYAIATYPKDEDIVCLSKENCDEIFRVVDIDNLDRKIRGLMMISGTSNGTIDHPNTGKMISLFNKAMELNKDKLFTEDDLRLAMHFGTFGEANGQTTTIGFIQSLQPTEIKVEIVLEEKYGWDLHSTPPQKEFSHLEPKLDKNSDLILKRK
jgi:hypothetical protein